MSEEKKPWSNEVSRSAGEYLPREEFENLKNDLKTAWRSLGWIHLRMTSDLDTKNSSPLSRAQLNARLTEVKKEIEKMMNVYLGDC